MHANALVVMAKAPLAGEVKTRLVPPLSPQEAAGLSRCLLLDLLEELRSFRRADLFIAFTPAEQAALFDEMARGHFVCFPQKGEDLGERMNHAFTELSDKGYRNTVLVGSDLPVFPARFLEEAFAALQGPGESLVVLGPSRDGGYYLIGTNGPNREIFEGIPWGTNCVLSKTAQKLTHLGLIPHLLPAWFDIDTLGDLRYLVSMVDQTPGHFQRNTLGFLRKFRSRGIRL